MAGSNISSRYMSTSHSLPQRFLEHVQRARLFRAAGGGTAVVAVSGGPDSVTLLDLLAGMAPTLGLQLLVAHAGPGCPAIALPQVAARRVRRPAQPADVR